jgi:hypothetical protein
MGRRPHPARVGRSEIANHAARLLVDGGVVDFDSARRKALRELGAEQSRDLPDNLELHRAVIDYLRLFHGARHGERIAHLRSVAYRALRLLAPFQPVLVGPVLYGTACEFTPISLHLRSDEFEAVTRFLLERRMSYELDETQLRVAGLAAPQRLPQILLTLYDEPFELTVLPAHNSRQPLSAIDGRAMQRADLAALDALIDSGEVFVGDFATRAAPQSP